MADESLRASTGRAAKEWHGLRHRTLPPYLLWARTAVGRAVEGRNSRSASTLVVRVIVANTHGAPRGRQAVGMAGAMRCLGAAFGKRR